MRTQHTHRSSRVHTFLAFQQPTIEQFRVLVLRRTQLTRAGSSACSKKLNMHSHSSSGKRGRAATCSARNPDNITVKTVRIRLWHARRSSLTCVGAAHHLHISTAAHVLASGATRMARGRSENVPWAANGPVSCLMMQSGAHTRAMVVGAKSPSSYASFGSSAIALPASVPQGAGL